MMKSSSFASSKKLFDWFFVVSTGIWVVGAYVDGWAHLHLPSTLESFFTPWHGIFYGGMALSGSALLVELIRNHKNGYEWKKALPKEYFIALGGVVFASAAGVGDLIWHQVFGIEADIEALLSPTHILLAVGGATAIGSPFFSLWFRARNAIPSLPVMLSASYFIAIIVFMLQFLNPFAYPWMAASYISQNQIERDYGVGLGVAGIIVFTSIFIGVMLAWARRSNVVHGGFTVALGVTTLLTTFMYGVYYEFVLTALVAGVLIDLFYSMWDLKERNWFRLFSFVAPAILFAVYAVTIFLTDQMGWSIHVWAGSVVIAGIVGFLMSYLSLPPAGSDL